ncbi:hypothetical protein P153DRAFT_431215 [Dothidotthia symphoricarpi CBS 119687]|uniref:Uncharacterized protein n=1 Tax=Dothidotthia symphoricarpi CBS 119687 TaxID=1392245 RepID=A0A6A6ABP1_9PLEO|nr:uncharacterized protein P153DRAFT_431215 [Dothidotthia symphoricarpi CBS 119687]KAF2129209.1 hypothetical protein P153DRAFT_431215 [Dothidotthia symphoricarpi CBS 119687]
MQSRRYLRTTWGEAQIKPRMGHTFPITVTPEQVRTPSSEDLNLASFLASLTSDGAQDFQRKDMELAEKMLKKQIERETRRREDQLNSSILATTQPSTTNTGRPDNRPPRKAQKALVLDPDWEAVALAQITKESMSLDKEWSQNTWNNKSNMFHRLKLLKDDGYDIAPLLTLTSADLTEVVLAHVDARRQRGARPNPSSLHQSIKATRASRVTRRPKSILDPRSAMIVSPQDDRFFAATLRYRPALSPSLKRKQTQLDDAESLNTSSQWWYLEPTSPSVQRGPKRRRANKITAEEQKKQARDAVRKNFVQSVFSSSCSEAATNDKASVSTVLFSTPDFGINTRLAHNDSISGASSRSSSSTHADTNKTLMMDSRGFENMMDELRFLADAGGNVRQFTIKDVSVRDIAEDNKDVQMLDVDVDTDTTSDTHHQLLVFANTHQDTVIRGNTEALIALMSRMRNHDLTYNADMSQIGLDLRTHGMSWSLSSNTQTVLGKIEEQLKTGVRKYGVEVRVNVFYGGIRCFAP